MSDFSNSLRATLMQVDCGGIGPIYPLKALSRKDFRKKYGDDAGNAYDDLVASRQRMRKVVADMRSGAVKTKDVLKEQGDDV